ncbi:hypothetical protein [Rhodopirellula sp. MGV]|uniref:hypothetical protein n=1 Tax=Rhodopirellula sp. MGV TaxID=2023130 RepID=UPI00130461E4|nr:hypothetical protein [Rhodopirellula sp. MGV]
MLRVVWGSWWRCVPAESIARGNRTTSLPGGFMIDSIVDARRVKATRVTLCKSRD